MQIVNFSAIFSHHLIAYQLWQFVLKFLGKSKGSRWSCKLNGMGCENWNFSTNISPYFENDTRHGHSYN